MDLVHSLSDRLLFAVPKKGRLNEACLNLLSGSDIQFHRHSRLDIALVKNLPIALIFLPAADIPTFVGEGRVDLAITGRDQVAEHFDRRGPSRHPPRQRFDAKGNPIVEGVDEVMDLGFGRCKLQVQVPEVSGIDDPKQLIGKDIVTSYTELTDEYFRKLEGLTDDSKLTQTRIKFVGGSVEAACALGVADAVVDLVESGETMRAAGLKAIDTVLESTAVLIKSKAPSNPALVELITSRIRGVISEFAPRVVHKNT